ncbi:MAG: DUF2760 domain-containing protein [Deltaproteobacteria bacterium]|nr:DUF2760 domain-containing protein [Deltaproteobacteria bacterium]
MYNVNKTSNRVAFPIIFFSLLIAGAFGVLAYFGVSELIEEMRPILQANAEKAAAQTWDLVLFYYSRFWYAVFPAMLGFALLVGILAWLIVRSSIRRLTPAAEGNNEIVKQGPEKEKQDLAERRMFLHLFSMMQREGRLMDFLAEDLDQYEDSQIGSAVRAIHAGCRRIVQEYLDPQPVLIQAEGENVVIDGNFDPGAIKLTGKVVGEPPFEGILRHKGWQVGKLKLPTLSGRQNAKIITPAEVEL